MEITDERLMAFTDGELDPAEARDVAARVAEDPALRERLRLFTASRAALSGLTAPPVPDALAARIRALSDTAPAANVVPLAPRRHRRWQLPAAAAVALAVGLGAGLFARPMSPVFGTVGDLAAALSSVPAGEEATVGDGTLHVISTFRTADGTLCREFEHDGADGRRLTSVACHAEGAWDLRLAVAGGGSDGYAPVSSGDALEAWFTGAEAGPALDPAAEAEALSGL
ncbi:anti-sigma factor family protein [Falsirhodobacter sp. 20TX0035]|uniref:anti-sigma factor family protein n=1 Tax=Falsirhodobacter sp. 20TX0035 TaxID=3022019 RepID=UPI00232D5519|nr:hypothetical protein [Falsirhodobacter sp. 20TX0035]MDB6452599.1 hypothetical protein [Falsirhodobacter sp. 20TX0035]